MDRCSSPHDSFRSYDYSPDFPDRPIGPATAKELHTLDLTSLCPQDQDYVKRYLDSDTLGQMLNRAAPGTPGALLKDPRAVFVWSHRHGKMPWFLRVIEHQVLCWGRLSAACETPIEPQPSEWLLDILIRCRNHGATGESPVALTHDLSAIMDTFAAQGIRLCQVLLSLGNEQRQAVLQSLTNQLNDNDYWLIPVLAHCQTREERDMFVTLIKAGIPIAWSHYLFAAAWKSDQLDRLAAAMNADPALLLHVHPHALKNPKAALSALDKIGLDHALHLEVGANFPAIAPFVEKLLDSPNCRTQSIALSVYAPPSTENYLPQLADSLTKNRSLIQLDLEIDPQQPHASHVADMALAALAAKETPASSFFILRITGPLSLTAQQSLTKALQGGQVKALKLHAQPSLQTLLVVLRALLDTRPAHMPLALEYRTTFKDKWKRAMEVTHKEWQDQTTLSSQTTYFGGHYLVDRPIPQPSIMSMQLRQLLDEACTPQRKDERLNVLKLFTSLFQKCTPSSLNWPYEMMLPMEDQLIQDYFSPREDWPSVAKKLAAQCTHWAPQSYIVPPILPQWVDLPRITACETLDKFFEAHEAQDKKLSSAEVKEMQRKLRTLLTYDALRSMHQCESTPSIEQTLNHV